MGCRTRVIANRHGPAISDQRGNLSFTTINLPRLAIKSKGHLDAFFSELESTLMLAARQVTPSVSGSGPFESTRYALFNGPGSLSRLGKPHFGGCH